MVAAWLAACYPPLVWIAAYALSERSIPSSRSPPRGCSGWSPTRRRRRGRRPGRRTAHGSCSPGFGRLAALTRPSMLFFLPFAALLLMWRGPITASVSPCRACSRHGPPPSRRGPAQRRRPRPIRPDRLRRRRHVLDRQPPRGPRRRRSRRQPAPQDPEPRVPGAARRPLRRSVRAALLPRGARLHRRRSGVVARARRAQVVVHDGPGGPVLPAALATVFLGLGGLAAVALAARGGGVCCAPRPAHGRRRCSRSPPPRFSLRSSSSRRNVSACPSWIRRCSPVRRSVPRAIAMASCNLCCQCTPSRPHPAPPSRSPLRPSRRRWS